MVGSLRDCYAELLERKAGTPAPVPSRPAGPEPAGTQPTGLEAGGPAGPLVLVVAMRRPLAMTSLAPVPGDLARGLFVVTTTARDGDDAALPEGPSWIEVDPDRAYTAARAAVGGRRGSRRLSRRILRFIRHPLRPFRLRRLAAERPMLRARSLREDLASILAGSGTASGVEIFALTADDADLVLPLLNDRVRLAPATLRGLVDRWDAAGRPVVQPPAVAAPTAVYDPDSYWERLHHRGELSTVGQSGMSPELNAWLTGRSRRTSDGSCAGMPSIARSRKRCSRWVPGSATGSASGARWGSPVSTAATSCRRPSSRRAKRRSRWAEGDYVVANLATPGALPGRTYGLVSCFNVLLHLVDDDAFSVALENVAGLVADGGYLVLAEPILYDSSFERPRDPSRTSRARPVAAYRDGLVAAGLELVALEPATVLANNPMEAQSVRMLGYYVRWWRFVKRRDRVRSRWIGPLVAGLDRLAIRTGQAPTTKFALFRRPPARG